MEFKVELIIKYVTVDMLFHRNKTLSVSTTLNSRWLLVQFSTHLSLSQF